METTFGEQFESFTMSLDTVDTPLCDSVREVFHDYVLNVLCFDFYHVMVDGTKVDDKPGLHTASTSGNPWCNDGSGSVPIHGGDGSFFAQSTFSYEQRVPIWVTGENDETLNETSNYKEHWEAVEVLPKFYSKEKTKIKTSIVVPLVYGERVFGFICVESRKKFKFSKHAAEELQRLSRGVGIVLWLHNAYLHQRKCAKETFSKIKDIVTNREISSPFLRPKIFIASSARADPAVVGCIRSVVDDFSEIFEEVFWHELKDSGDVNSQITDEMKKSRFGICYLSEPVGEGEYRYSDNANVIFEAGMLESLGYAINAATQAWIPVRESDSSPPPFDMRQQRTIIVERKAGGDLNKEQFKSDLGDAIKALCMR